MNWRFHSGTAIRKLEMALSIHPHLLTVAGAAQAFQGISEKKLLQSIT
jgi:hypothetical protein